MKTERIHDRSARRLQIHGGRSALVRLLPGLLLALVVTGCGGGMIISSASNSVFHIAPGTASIDTNCTGCNRTNRRGVAVLAFGAELAAGGAAEVEWSVRGGDPVSGAGTINAAGEYQPPSYLSAESTRVVVSAALKADPAVVASAVVVVHPGFLEPLSPQNVALGAGGRTTVRGVLAETGSGGGMRFHLADAPEAETGGVGELGASRCEHVPGGFARCTVNYRAPQAVPSAGVTYLVATTGEGQSHTAAAVLLNAAGVSSSPAIHQARQPEGMLLGGSGGHAADYDARGNQVVDCCGGTLGALVADDKGQQYILSNNHVLALSDRAQLGDAVVAPGLIDAGCRPQAAGGDEQTVAHLFGWLRLDDAATNADAALAAVEPGKVDAAGRILELGERAADGRLESAAPAAVANHGRGVEASLGLLVAKSGRTTGLTCGTISAIDVDVDVDYFSDCAETRPYRTHRFLHQIAASGNAFTDAGDSGALLVDAASAEPLGLYFAGGTDVAGVSHAMATPAPALMDELDRMVPGLHFVGAEEHGVRCLSYGDNTRRAAQTEQLAEPELRRAERAATQAKALVRSIAGVRSVAVGRSGDRLGEAAVVVETETAAGIAAEVPATVGGVRTVVLRGEGTLPSMEAVERARAVKQERAAELMRRWPAVFAVGVGRSVDDPAAAALVLFVDRRRIPALLPATLEGVRTHVILMDRLHVTRAFGLSGKSCPAQAAVPALHRTITDY